MIPAAGSRGARPVRSAGLSRLAAGAAILAIGAVLAGCIPTVTVVRNQATVTATGLPADGTITPGQGLPNLKVSAAFGKPTPQPEGWSPKFGEVESVTVTFTYTTASGTPGKAGPYAGNWGTFKLPADAKPGTTLDIVTEVKSPTVVSPVVFLDGQTRSSYAVHSETTASLRVVAGGGGGGGGNGDDCAPPASTAPAPVASLLALATPLSASVGSSVDARLSSDPLGRTLTYTWDLDGDCVFDDDPRDQEPGIASVEATERPSVVRVRVSTTGGGEAQASLNLTWDSNLLNNAEVKPDSTAAYRQGFLINIDIYRGLDSAVTTGCLDFDGDGAHDDGVVTFNDFFPRRLVEKTVPVDSPVGRRPLSATFWRTGTNSSCANTGTSGEGLVQRAQRTYRVDAASPSGASSARATRQGSASRYTASSSLRLNPTTSPVAGKAWPDGTVRGTVTRGTFTFTTPAKAGKAKRPAGLGDLARGTYVARAATSTISGTGEPGRAVYTGTSTVLLRGRNGTLACISAEASIASTVLTMRGATGKASRLAFTAIQTQTPFALPTIEEYARQIASKRPPKAKPVIGKGPITASTAKKAKGLNATCKGLRKYLR